MTNIACQSNRKKTQEVNPFLSSTPPKWEARGYNECEAQYYQILEAKKLSARQYRFSVQPRYCSRRDLWICIRNPYGQEKLYELVPNKDFSCFSRDITFNHTGKYYYQICVKVQSGYYPNLHPDSFQLLIT